MEGEKVEIMPIRATSIFRNGDKSEIKISNLSVRELENMECMLNGQWWVRVEEDGRLLAVPGWKKPPTPIEDTKLAPYWPTEETKTEIQEELFDPDICLSRHSPSFYISHLCGHFYTPKRYKEEAEKLESYGFECMRSRRGTDGKYWEVWYLAGIWSAYGKLEEYMQKKKREIGKIEIKDIVDFLCRNVQFGSLDVVVQRAVMPIPD